MPHNVVLQLVELPTLNASIKHKIEAPRASTMIVHAPKVNDEVTHLQLIGCINHVYIPTQHGHTKNNNGFDNGLKDHHYTFGSQRHVNIYKHQFHRLTFRTLFQIL